MLKACPWAPTFHAVELRRWSYSLCLRFTCVSCGLARSRLNVSRVCKAADASEKKVFGVVSNASPTYQQPRHRL